MPGQRSRRRGAAYVASAAPTLSRTDPGSSPLSRVFPSHEQAVVLYDRLAAATARARIAATGTAGFSVLRCLTECCACLSVSDVRSGAEEADCALVACSISSVFCSSLRRLQSVRAGNWRREHPILAPRRSTCLKGAKNGLIECINGKNILEGENQ